MHVGCPQMSYLGHHVTRDSLLPDPLLLWAVCEIPAPQNIKELLPFLGLASYYHRYVKGFTAIASCLHAVTKKDVVYC